MDQDFFRAIERVLCSGSTLTGGFGDLGALVCFFVFCTFHTSDDRDHRRPLNRPNWRVSRQRARLVLLVPRPDSAAGDQRKPDFGRFGAVAVLKARAVERIGKRRSVEMFRPFGVYREWGEDIPPSEDSVVWACWYSFDEGKMKRAERTVEDLKRASVMYDLANDAPFVWPPNENVVRAHNADFMDDAQGVLDFMKKKGAACGNDSRSDQTADAPLTSEEKFLLRVPPATNRGPVTYHGEKYPANWGGYDGGVEASIFGSWDSDSFLEFTRFLDKCKQASDDGDLEESFIEFGGFVWKVWAKGANVGFFKYKWVLETHGVKIYVHSNPRTPTVIPVRVRFGFECLVRTNLFVAVETLKKSLADVGFTWERETVSRVDMQVLLPVDIYEFADVMKGKRVVTRCRGKCEIVSDCKTMRIQTITLRSSNAEICIYDKMAQVNEADDVYYATFNRWVLNYENPDFLTRVEFRFRREMLKRYGITTFDDLKKSQSALPQIFGRDWFRILEREKVRGSENEIKNASIWDRTLRAFEVYFSSKTSPSRSCSDLRSHTERKSLPNAKRVLKQAVGCLASFASVCHRDFIDAVSSYRYCCDILKEFSEILYFKILEKQVENEVIRGYTVDGLSSLDCMKEIRLAFVPSPIRQYYDIF